jgi:MoaA/NifB/PqqE/SkfB family radical SAM enzyme
MSEKIIYINLGLLCNEHCLFCVNSSVYDPLLNIVPLEEIKKIINTFIKEDGEIVMLTGGEPTLRNDLPEIIQYIGQFKNIKLISILTNGVRLSDKKYFLRLIEADTRKILQFSVSLHSHKKEISDLLTQSTNTFEKTLGGISNLLLYNQRLSIYQVITSYNYKDLFDFCEFVHINFPSINKLVFAYPFPYGKALINNDIYVRFDLLKPFFLKALKFLEENNYIITIANCGQIPLCVLTGFEEKVIDPRIFNYENVVGTAISKQFIKYEYTDNEWIKRNKNKSENCHQCLLNTICQGVFNKYIELFNFQGINPISVTDFKGNKLEIILRNQDDIDYILQKLIVNKINLIVLKDYQEDLLNILISKLSSQNILAIIYTENEGVMYPFPISH